MALNVKVNQNIADKIQEQVLLQKHFSEAIENLVREYSDTKKIMTARTLEKEMLCREYNSLKETFEEQIKIEQNLKEEIEDIKGELKNFHQSEELAARASINLVIKKYGRKLDRKLRKSLSNEKLEEYKNTRRALEEAKRKNFELQKSHDKYKVTQQKFRQVSVEYEHTKKNYDEKEAEHEKFLEHRAELMKEKENLTRLLKEMEKHPETSCTDSSDDDQQF